MVLATSALHVSLGVNFKEIRYVVHYGPAPDLRSQLQETIRARRDGKQSLNVILHHGQQLHLCVKQIKQCIKVSTCLHVAFLKQFVDDVEPLNNGHDCCSSCHQTCKCGGDKCNVEILSFEIIEVAKAVPTRERSINDKDVSDLH